MGGNMWEFEEGWGCVNCGFFKRGRWCEGEVFWGKEENFEIELSCGFLECSGVGGFLKEEGLEWEERVDGVFFGGWKDDCKVFF